MTVKTDYLPVSQQFQNTGKYPVTYLTGRRLCLTKRLAPIIMGFARGDDLGPSVYTIGIYTSRKARISLPWKLIKVRIGSQFLLFDPRFSGSAGVFEAQPQKLLGET